jgi:hypothetical protein
MRLVVPFRTSLILTAASIAQRRRTRTSCSAATTKGGHSLNINLPTLHLHEGGLTLIGMCDTCGRLSELFRLPDRRDSNCPECNADISILVLLYTKWKIAVRNGEQSEDLEAQLVPMLHRFLERSEPGLCANAAWPEATSRENLVN